MPHAETNSSDGIFIVVMITKGVSGCGKSTLAKTLAREMNIPFYDADDLHPKSNVEKMSRGEPLSDADREPWLYLIRSTAEHVLEDQQRLNGARKVMGCVVACSALKRYYRDILRGLPTVLSHSNPTRPVLTYFVYIHGKREVLLERMKSRKGHFMKSDMLDSQLQTLESPEGEKDVVMVSADTATECQVRIVKERLASR